MKFRIGLRNLLLDGSLCMRLPKIFGMVGVLLLAGALSAQTPSSGNPPRKAFTLLNLLPESAKVKLFLGETSLKLVDEDSPSAYVSAGFHTGMIPWEPAGSVLRAEAAGKKAVELKAFLKDGETSLVILDEDKEKNLVFTIIPNAKERPPAFFDGLNLTREKVLDVTANGKPFRLARGQRTRLSTDQKLSFSIKGEAVDPIEPNSPKRFLLVFYTAESQRTWFILIPDRIL